MAISRQVRRSLALALAGLLGGLGLVFALFGGGDFLRRMTVRPEAEAPATFAPPTGGDPVGGAPRKADSSQGGGPSVPAPGADGADPGKAAAAQAPEAPRFDIVRVEPNGEAVVAGRGAPNTVVEMLVDGKPVAKALADPTGQFAIVPPALPVGASEIQLRTKAADGRESRSAQTVAVDVAPGRDRKPLVALTAPDKPTVVLSEPGMPEPKLGAQQFGAPQPGAQAGAPPPAAAGAGRPARIVSVDAQDGGRLYVTAAGTPGTELRLYLNDTLIAPGRVGPDGTVTFTIGRGVGAGRYAVRIDQIDPGTGKVRNRAEVPFTMPDPGHTATREAAPAAGSVAQGGMVEAGRGGPGTAGGAAPPAQDKSRRRASADVAVATPSGPGPAGTVFVPEISTARISRGDNLWRISQRTYGRGERYTVIFGANQDQIRDPDLIYPGQIFVLPADKRG